MRAACAPVVSRLRSTGYCGTSRQEHLLNRKALRAERLTNGRVAGVEAGADGLAIYAGGVREATHVAVEHQGRGVQAVGVLQLEQGGAERSCPPSGLSRLPSMRDSASAARSLGHRPCSAASQTARPSRHRTAAIPVSPPRRRSTMHWSCLQPVEAVGVESVRIRVEVAQYQGVVDPCSDLVLEPRRAPGDRQGRSGHEGDAELGGAVVHPASVVPRVREVLVAEHRVWFYLTSRSSRRPARRSGGAGTSAVLARWGSSRRARL